MVPIVVIETKENVHDVGLNETFPLKEKHGNP
jgi:hypothetical protein